ncbi:MAG TPA: glutaredoxin domain-containing protein [Acidobacteriota bacterium]|nr:glutaredoxin domain-containing protein [Acidobacteriota bacterium]
MANKVVMYCTTWCGDCRAAEAFLDKNNVQYIKVNIEDDDEAAKLVMRVNNGKRSVPTFDVDGQYVNASPFSPEKRKRLAEVLELPS